MFGIISRRKAEAKTAPEDDGIRAARIDRALRREGVAVASAGIEATSPPETLVDAPHHAPAAESASVQPVRPEISAGSDEPAPDAKEEPDLASHTGIDRATPVGAAPQADPAEMAEPVGGRTEAALAPLLKMLHGGFRTTWSTARAAGTAGRAASAAVGPRAVEAPANAHLAGAPVDRVVVPRSAFDSFARDTGDYDLVRAIATFVDMMLVQGLHTRAELPDRTLQLYHADQYLSHVNSGGHRRMIHAVGGRLARMLADARTAFIAIGATAALDALNRFTDWLAGNPDEAARPVAVQQAATGIPEELDRLVQDAVLADTVARAAAWITGWDDLVVVDDADHAATLQAMAMANPLREHRLVQRSIRQLHRQLTDPVLAATGMVCAACPDPEIRLAVEGPVTVEVDGAPQAVYVLRTNEAMQRLCVLDDAGAAIHEQAPTEPTDLDGLSDMEDMEQALATGVLPEAQLPRTGRRLAHIGVDRIDRAIELARDRHAAAGIDLLLRRAELEPENTAASPAVIEMHPDGQTVTFLVAAQGKALFVASTPKGAVLVRPHGMQTLVSASAADIAAHAAGATQGAPRPRSVAAGGR